MSILSRIENYKKVTLDVSLKEVMKSKNRIISGKYSPVVYEMNYEEIKYVSIDGVNLYGWYIKRSENKDTIIMIHGRNNNRIFCMKFLQIIADIDKECKYNIFIPDLRNSGKSDECKTGFGYLFAKDIYSTMLMLNEKFNLNNFVLYAFSQGAIGSAAAVYFYKKELEEKNIKVSKMILDSPVSNVKKIIAHNARIFDIQIPYIFLMFAFFKFNKNIDYNLNKMRLSKLLGIVPCLILQSKKDEATPYKILLQEYDILKKREQEENIAKTDFKIFRKGHHVRMYLQYKEEYTQTINKFLESEII